jgi:hypothetical protein
MMPGSLKALDLRRDPRFALHANPGGGTDPETATGDVRICGRLTELTAEAAPGALASSIAEVGPPQPFPLFRADLGEVVRTWVEGDLLYVRSWRPAEDTVTRSRR